MTLAADARSAARNKQPNLITAAGRIDQRRFMPRKRHCAETLLDRQRFRSVRADDDVPICSLGMTDEEKTEAFGEGQEEAQIKPG